jgi:hypothetical protein
MMRQYRITAADFQQQTEPDAVMDTADLRELKRLAGMPITEAEAGMYSGQNSVPQATETGITSPVGSNISQTAAERNALLDKYQARPGTDLWFLINFTKPFFPGGSLEDHIARYFRQHPERRPKQPPGQ